MKVNQYCRKTPEVVDARIQIGHENGAATNQCGTALNKIKRPRNPKLLEFNGFQCCDPPIRVTQQIVTYGPPIGLLGPQIGNDAIRRQLQTANTGQAVAQIRRKILKTLAFNPGSAGPDVARQAMSQVKTGVEFGFQPPAEVEQGFREGCLFLQSLVF